MLSINLKLCWDRAQDTIAEVPSTLILREAFQNFHFGLGAAMSMGLVILTVMIAIGYIRFFQPGKTIEE